MAQGIAAAKAGRNAEARELLMEVIRHDWRNEMGWLWLSSVVDTDEQRRTCLQRVLATNPNNDAAKWGLEILAGRGNAQPLTAESPRSPGGALPRDEPGRRPVAAPAGEGPESAARPVSRGGGAGRIWQTLLWACGVVAALVLAACFIAIALGPAPPPTAEPATLPPEQVYAHAMAPALTRLVEWLNGPVLGFYSQVNAPLPNSTERTYGTTLSLCMEEQDACREPALRQLRDGLVPASRRVAESGAEVQAALGAITPPAAIRASHEQVVACVTYRMELVSAIADFLTSGTLPGGDLDSDPCDLLFPALDRVMAFVQDNQ